MCGSCYLATHKDHSAIALNADEVDDYLEFLLNENSKIETKAKKNIDFLK